MDVSNLLGEKLLQGWTMLAEVCLYCQVELFTRNNKCELETKKEKLLLRFL